jgi:hypothetical protein
VGFPEIPDLLFQVNELEAMRKAMVRDVHVFMMHTVATKVTCVNTMENGLLNPSAFCVMKKVTGKTRARDAMPEALRLAGMGAL